MKKINDKQIRGMVNNSKDDTLVIEEGTLYCDRFLIEPIEIKAGDIFYGKVVIISNK